MFTGCETQPSLTPHHEPMNPLLHSSSAAKPPTTPCPTGVFQKIVDITWFKDSELQKIIIKIFNYAKLCHKMWIFHILKTAGGHVLWSAKGIPRYVTTAFKNCVYLFSPSLFDSKFSKKQGRVYSGGQTSMMNILQHHPNRHYSFVCLPT